MPDNNDIDQSLDELSFDQIIERYGKHVQKSSQVVEAYRQNPNDETLNDLADFKEVNEKFRQKLLKTSHQDSQKVGMIEALDFYKTLLNNEIEQAKARPQHTISVTRRPAP